MSRLNNGGASARGAAHRASTVRSWPMLSPDPSRRRSGRPSPSQAPASAASPRYTTTYAGQTWRPLPPVGPTRAPATPTSTAPAVPSATNLLGCPTASHLARRNGCELGLRTSWRAESDSVPQQDARRTTARLAAVLVAVTLALHLPGLI